MLLNILIAKSYDLDRQGIDNMRSQRIILLLRIMNRAVKFYHQFFLKAKEICDKKALLSIVIKKEWMLTIKFRAEQSAVTHKLPKNFFGVCLIFP